MPDSPPESPQAACAGGPRLLGRLSLADRRCLVGHPIRVVALHTLGIAHSPKRNLFLSPAAGPTDLVLLDPVVRPAGELPASDRWLQRDRVTIEHQVPPSWLDWCHDLLTAAARATMNCCPVSDRDV